MKKNGIDMNFSSMSCHWHHHHPRRRSILSQNSDAGRPYPSSGGEGQQAIISILASLLFIIGNATAERTVDPARYELAPRTFGEEKNYLPACTKDSDCAPLDRCISSWSCGPDGVCVRGVSSCPQPRSACLFGACIGKATCAIYRINCDDGDDTTIDSCDATIGCVHQLDCSAPGTRMCPSYDDESTRCVLRGSCCDDSECPAPDACTISKCSADTQKCERSPATCDDGDACTRDGCDPQTGCYHSQYGPDYCDDNDRCTLDSCDSSVGCVHVARNCTGRSKCYEYSCDQLHGCVTAELDCDDGDPCTVDDCSPATGCIHMPVACTSKYVCLPMVCDPQVGGCVQTHLDCDDHDACTSDSCDPILGCVHSDVDCDDDDLCTIDACDTALGCVHVGVDCNDDDPCTDDRCSPIVGCFHNPTVCTSDNECIVGTCIPDVGCGTVPVVCDDADPCTADVCDPVWGCSSVSLCTDPDQECFVDDFTGVPTCGPRKCGIAADPEMRVPRCSGSSVHQCCRGECVPKTDPPAECCEDSDCVSEQVISGVVCCAGKCSVAECCGQLVPDPQNCADGICADGKCRGCISDAECVHNNNMICDETTGRCVVRMCSTDQQCVDGDACTIDSCDQDAGRCVHEPHDWPCACHTSLDCGNCTNSSMRTCSFCDRGLCRPILSCEDNDDECIAKKLTESRAPRGNSARFYAGKVADPHAGPYIVVPGKDGYDSGQKRVLRADEIAKYNALALKESKIERVAGPRMTTKDEHPTVDYMAISVCPAVLSIHELWDAIDGATPSWLKSIGIYDPWTEDGAFPVSTRLSCAEFQNRFDEIKYQEEQHGKSLIISRNIPAGSLLVVDVCADGDPCTLDSCARDPFTNIPYCVHRTKSCDDENECTDDYCAVNGTCVHTATDCASTGDLTCRFNQCFVGDGLCYPVSTTPCWEPNPNGCTPTTCENGRCVRRPLDCNDGNPCTVDSCISPIGVCRHLIKSCEDGNARTQDTCSSTTGLCSHTLETHCINNDLCHFNGTISSHCVVQNISCDDGNACTRDSCDPALGCLHVSVTCHSSDPCVTAVCNPTSGACVRIVRTCDDGNACTTDSCNTTDGTCINTPKVCDDGNDCTTDACNPWTGACGHIDKNCDDDNACTLDWCVSGQGCMHSDITCDDADMFDGCATYTCDINTGIITATLKDCDDGDACTIDECTKGVCINRPPRFEDYNNDTHCVNGTSRDPKTLGDRCASRVSECMVFFCMSNQTGPFVWVPSDRGTECEPDDACHRYECDGAGHCTLKAGASTTCAQNSLGVAIVLIAVWSVVAAVLVIFLIIICGRYRLLTRRRRQRLQAQEESERASLHGTQKVA